MDSSVAVVNWHLGIDKRIQYDLTLLVNYRHFAEDVLEVGHIHLAINCNK